MDGKRLICIKYSILAENRESQPPIAGRLYTYTFLNAGILIKNARLVLSSQTNNAKELHSVIFGGVATHKLEMSQFLSDWRLNSQGERMQLYDDHMQLHDEHMELYGDHMELYGDHMELHDDHMELHD